MLVKKLYHAAVPKTVRYPIGRARRHLADLWQRQRLGEPLPPRELLQNVQMTPYVREYLDVGAKAASAIREEFERAGLSAQADVHVLDFGCGLSRTLRFLRSTRWRLAGCDVDERSVGWSCHALPGIEFVINHPKPPLPWPDATFDGLYAVSVFTHFPAAMQEAWAMELARVMRPSAIALITTMGPHAFGAFPNLATPSHRQTLRRDGFFFDRRGTTFNASGAFHTRDGIEQIFGEYFHLRAWRESGLDGFQDLSVLERRR